MGSMKLVAKPDWLSDLAWRTIERDPALAAELGFVDTTVPVSADNERPVRGMHFSPRRSSGPLGPTREPMTGPIRVVLPKPGWLSDEAWAVIFDSYELADELGFLGPPTTLPPRS